jgi:WD40 repeat protein
MQIISTHDFAIDALAFLPDGQAIASAGGVYGMEGLDGAVRIHALPSGTRIREWPAPPLWASLAITPDGERLIYGGPDAAGLYIRPIRGHGPDVFVEGSFPSLSVSPDGRVVATTTASEQPGLRLGIAFPQGGRFVSTAGGVRRVSVETGEDLPGGWGGVQASTAGETFPVEGIAYSPDGRTLATVSAVRGANGYDSHVLFWDAESGQPRGELAAAYRYEHPPQIAFSPDGTLLAARSGPVLRAWDVASHRLLVDRKTGTKHLKGMAFTPDGRRLITVSNDRSARVWDTSTWAELGGYAWKIGKLRAIAVSPDGLRIAAGGDTGKIVVWDNDH